jgi:hypothetical protein
MDALVIEAQLPPVQFRLWGREGGRLSEGRLGIDVKIAVVRMLLAEVVARLNLRRVPGQDLLQFFDEFLQVAAGEFSAEPKDQSWYLVHGGASLGNLASSVHQVLRRETSPPFSFPIKPDPARLARCPQPSKSTTTSLEAGGERRNRCSPQSIQRITGLKPRSF